MYYLRSTAAADAIKFTLDKSAVAQPVANAATAAAPVTAMVAEPQQTLDYKRQVADYDQKKADMACSLDNPDACEACGS
jgi:ribonucleoside-diphosphate reductase alpha chain